MLHYELQRYTMATPPSRMSSSLTVAWQGEGIQGTLYSSPHSGGAHPAEAAVYLGWAHHGSRSSRLSFPKGDRTHIYRVELEVGLCSGMLVMLWLTGGSLVAHWWLTGGSLVAH